MKRLVSCIFLMLLPTISAQAAEFKQARYIMGTMAEITLFADSEQKADAAFESAFAELVKVDKLMSNWKEDSEIMQVNREAGERDIPVSSELFEVLRASQYYSRLSCGAFDVTVGPLVRLWGFLGGEKRVPTDAEIRQALDKTGYEKISLDSTKRTVHLLGKDTYIDLGGIAKGYALDKAVDALKRTGIERALVDLGGNVYALETRPDGLPWEVGILHPRDKGILAVLKLKNQAAATSGDYEKLFTLNGKRYSHIINPRTGRPAEGSISATVIAPTAMASDALSTAVFVMGSEKGFNMLKKLPGTSGLVVNPEMEVRKWNLN